MLRDSVAWWLYYGGRLDEAEAEWITVSEFSPMKTVPGLCFVRVLLKRYTESVELAESWPDGEDATQCLALAYHGLGRTAEADAALERLVRLSGERDPRRVAEVHAFRGEPDDAFRWLDVAVEIQRARRQTMQGIWKTRMSPLLEPLHADARWQAWYDSAGSVSPP